jgi:hypothetical protein
MLAKDNGKSHGRKIFLSNRINPKKRGLNQKRRGFSKGSNPNQGAAIESGKVIGPKKAENTLKKPLSNVKVAAKGPPPS